MKMKITFESKTVLESFYVLNSSSTSARDRIIADDYASVKLSFGGNKLV